MIDVYAADGTFDHKHTLAQNLASAEGRAFFAHLAKGPTLAYRATKRILHTWRSRGAPRLTNSPEPKGRR
jgi:hypothetical protein